MFPDMNMNGMSERGTSTDGTGCRKRNTIHVGEASWPPSDLMTWVASYLFHLYILVRIVMVVLVFLGIHLPQPTVC